MTTPTAELHPDFSGEGAEAPPWSEVLAVIEAAEIFWLSTVRADGRPHVTPLPAMWFDGALHFSAGTEEQKTRNLDANPNCILTTGNNAFRHGLDVVVEGSAVRVTDAPVLEALAAMWQAKLDWPFEVIEGGFRDPARGPDAPLVLVFAVSPTKVLAFGRGEAFSQTRYRF